MFYFALYALAAKKFGNSRIKGLVRVSAYTTVVSVALGAVGIHQARAEVSETGMKFGADMASLASVLQDSHSIMLNGQRINISTATTFEGVSAVLDRFEANCKAGEGPDAQVWDTVPDTSKPPPKNPKPLTSAPIIRNGDSHRGMIACMVPGARSSEHTARALEAAVKQFKETGDFGAIGKLRYAYVTGNATGTSVVTVWTDDDFNMKALMPPTSGDAPGSDPVVMGRPSNTQRLFSGSIEKLPYSVYVYTSKSTPKEAVDNYDQQMHAAGWMSVTNPYFEEGPHEGQEGHAYLKDGRMGVVAATNMTGDTVVSVAEVAEPLKTGPITAPKASDGF